MKQPIKPVLEDISGELTEDGFKKIQEGQVMTFNYEGSLAHYKVVKKTRKKLLVQRINLYSPGDLKIIDKPL